MARRKDPGISPEERAKRERDYAEQRAALRARIEAEATARAQVWAQQQGITSEQDSVGRRQHALARYRQAIAEQSAPAYRPTLLQQWSAPAPGIVEIEF